MAAESTNGSYEGSLYRGASFPVEEITLFSVVKTTPEIVQSQIKDVAPNNMQLTAARSQTQTIRSGLAMVGESSASTGLAAAKSAIMTKGQVANNFTFPASALHFGDGSPNSFSSYVSPFNFKGIENALAPQVEATVLRVQQEANPQVALQVLSDLCKKSPPWVTEKVLADARIETILDNLVVELTKTSPNETPAIAAENVFSKFEYATVTLDYDSAVKRALLNQAFKSTRLITVLQRSLPPDTQIAGFLNDEKVRELRKLNPEAFFALLSQIKNYPDKRVIENLRLLAGKMWFRGCPPDDQQRFAKIIAFASQYTGVGDASWGGITLPETLSFILGPDGPPIEWADMAWAGFTAPRVLNWIFRTGSSSYIQLNRKLVPAGNDKLTDDSAVDIATETLGHETSHVRHNDSWSGRSRSGSFEHEYRAYYDSHPITSKHPLNQQEGYYWMHVLIKLDGPYGNIAESFRKKGSKSSDEIVSIIGRAIEMDNPTVDKILEFDREFKKNPNILSDKKPALPPHWIARFRRR